MLDTAHETLLTLQEVAKRFKVTVQTVHGWANRHRERRLETVKIGGAVRTSEEAVSRFLRDCNQQPAVLTPVGDSGESAASRELREKFGI